MLPAEPAGVFVSRGQFQFSIGDAEERRRAGGVVGAVGFNSLLEMRRLRQHGDGG